MKYKEGDKVKVKSIEWYNDKKSKYGRIDCSEMVFFESNMSKFCGSILTIKNIDLDTQSYKVEENTYYWTDDMFEGLAEEGICDEEFKNAINDAYNACLDDKDDIDPLRELCQSKLSAVIIDSDVFKDEVELILNGYEVIARGDKTYAVKKKPKYPTTYEECCSVLGMTFDYPNIGMVSSKEYCLYSRFIRLIRCRDAYWKIAEEEMGLGKPWEFENPAKRYVFTIEYYVGNIILNAAVGSMRNRILVFPTEEMRDAFYENFKDLIEKCKELL